MRHRQIPGEIQENGGRGRFSGGTLKFGSVSKFGRISPEQLLPVPHLLLQLSKLRETTNELYRMRSK